MSNRRRLDPISHHIARMDDARIPGGCEHCDAYHTIRAHAYGHGIHALTVHHDDGCPVLARAEGLQPGNDHHRVT